MSKIAKIQARVAALIVAGGLAGAAVVAQPGASASADTVDKGVAPTIVLVRSVSDEATNLRGVVSRLQRQGYTVVTAPTASTGDVADSAGVVSFLQTIGGSIVLVADAPHDAAVGKAASDDAQVKAVVYVSTFDAGNTWSQGPLSCTFNGTTALSGLPFLSSVGAPSPTCTTRQEAFEAATAAGIARTVQSVELASLGSAHTAH